jgi:hypothetical protein
MTTSTTNYKNGLLRKGFLPIFLSNKEEYFILVYNLNTNSNTLILKKWKELEEKI